MTEVVVSRGTILTQVGVPNFFGGRRRSSLDIADRGSSSRLGWMTVTTGVSFPFYLSFTTGTIEWCLCLQTGRTSPVRGNEGGSCLSGGPSFYTGGPSHCYPYNPFPLTPNFLLVDREFLRV